MACVFQNVAEKKQRRKENAGFIEYRTHFALWCLFGVPLMMDCDLRTVNEVSKALMLNKELIAIDQDEECRLPYLAGKSGGDHQSASVQQ